MLGLICGSRVMKKNLKWQVRSRKSSEKLRSTAIDEARSIFPLSLPCVFIPPFFDQRRSSYLHAGALTLLLATLTSKWHVANFSQARKDSGAVLDTVLYKIHKLPPQLHCDYTG
jgi:hypothetical protein